MKPDWKDAPEWAQWLALDENGQWCWHEEKPQRLHNKWESDKRICASQIESTSWLYSLEGKGNGSV